MATNNDKEMERLAKKINKHYSHGVKFKSQKSKSPEKEIHDLIGSKKEKLNREAVVTVIGFYGVLFGIVYMAVVAAVLLIDVALLNATAGKKVKVINDNAIKYAEVQLDNYAKFNEKIDNDVDNYSINNDDFFTFVRESFTTRNDISSLYIEHNGEINYVDKYSKEKVQNTNDIYLIINEFINSDKQTDVSGFAYDHTRSKYVKLVMRKIYKNDQYLGTVALSDDLIDGGYGITKYLDTIGELNYFILDENQNIIYKSNRLNDIIDRIFTKKNEKNKIPYNNDLLGNQKEENTIDTLNQPLFGYGKNKDKDNRYADLQIANETSQVMAGKEKYSGFFETFGGQIFENINNVKAINTKTKFSYQKSEKGNFTLVIEYAEFIRDHIRTYIFVCTIILVMVLICSYIYSMNSPDTLLNVKILGGFFVAFLLVEAVTLAIAYTSIHMNIEYKKELSESLLLENYIGKQYDINTLIVNKTNDVYKDKELSEEDMLNVRKVLEKEISEICDISKEANLEVLVGLKNTTNEALKLQYDNMKKKLNEGIGDYCTVNQDETKMNISKLYEVSYQYNSVIYEISYDLEMKDLNLDKIDDETIKVYVENDEATYYIGEKVEEEELNNKLNYKKVKDNMYAAIRGNRVYTKFYDTNFNVDYIFMTIANKNFIESGMDVIVELIWVIAIAWVIYTVLKAKIVEVVDNANNSKIYGEIVYMKKDELERVVQIKEEREKIKEEEKIALDESYKNFLIRKKKLNVSSNDEEEHQEQTMFGNKKKVIDTNKNLDIFRTDKKIFKNYTELLTNETRMQAKSMQEKAQMQNEMYSQMNIVNGPDENEDDNINHDITLGEALTLFEKKKTNKQKQKEDSNEDKLYEKNSKELLSSSKDEEFGKILAQKYKDTKK